MATNITTPPIVVASLSDFLNVMPDDGRFTVQQDPQNPLLAGDFQSTPFFDPHNRTVVSQADRFYDNNSTFGGTGNPLGQDVQELLSAMGRTSFAGRHGVEFYVANYQMGADTDVAYTDPNGITRYLITTNDSKVTYSIGNTNTCAMWIRLKGEGTSGNKILLRNLGTIYVNGVAQSDDVLLGVSSGWTHVVSQMSAANTSLLGFPSIYASANDVVQIACPAFFFNTTNPGIHTTPLPSLVPQLPASQVTLLDQEQNYLSSNVEGAFSEERAFVIDNLSKPVDVTSTDTTFDKAISNLLGKGWQDHLSYTIDPTATDTVRNKHVSDADAKSWDDHLVNYSNPHQTTAAQVQAVPLAGGVDAAMTGYLYLPGLFMDYSSTSYGITVGDTPTAFGQGNHYFNARYDAEIPAHVYIDDGPATWMSVTSDSGVRIKTAPSGTSTAPITWSTVVQIYPTGVGEELTVGADRVWHAGNDGAGSGLDADTLRANTLGHSSGQIPISDGTLNTNLHADISDHMSSSIGNLVAAHTTPGGASGYIPIAGDGVTNVGLTVDNADRFEFRSIVNRSYTYNTSGGWTYRDPHTFTLTGEDHPLYPNTSLTFSSTDSITQPNPSSGFDGVMTFNQFIYYWNHMVDKLNVLIDFINNLWYGNNSTEYTTFLSPLTSVPNPTS